MAQAFLACWLLLASFVNGGYVFDYSHHGEDWFHGECAARDRQSPIDFPYVKAPWKCNPPVLAVLENFMGAEHFNALGFAKLAGKGPPPAAPVANVAYLIASEEADLGESSDVSFAQMNKSKQPMTTTTPFNLFDLGPIETTPAPPMIIDGCPHLAAFYFRYDMAEKPLSIQNNGHAITTDLKGHGLGTIHFEGYNFDVLSVNFHVNSEHTFKGKSYPLELHIVHREAETNQILVVAIPFDVPASKSASFLQRGRKRRDCSRRGRPDMSNEPCAPLDPVAESTKTDAQKKALVGAANLSPAQAAMIASTQVSAQPEPKPSDPGYCEALQNLMIFPLPKQGETGSVPLRDGPVDLIGPLISGPADCSKKKDAKDPYFPQGFFQYSGSLTAPPCTEQVTWLVRKDPIMASKSQVEALRVTIMEANSNFPNSRSVMPLMGRAILYSLAIQGDPPKPPDRPNDPNVKPKDRHVQFRGVSDGQEAMMRALEASRAKDMISAGVGAAQDSFAGAGAGVLPGMAAQNQGGFATEATTPLPTANPERVLSRIVDAVAEQMDGAESSAALAAAGVR